MEKLLDTALEYVNPNTPPFMETFVVIALCPLIWNSIARFFRFLTHDVFPSTPSSARYLLCYAMTVWILLFSGFRDYLFHRCLYSQPTLSSLHSTHPLPQVAGALLIGAGQVFVWSSFLALGVTGTFLGDYVGILMDAPVTSFPFSLLANPMYVGSTLSFLGSSLWNESAAGLALTLWVWVVYLIALQFEEPYTAMIYQQRETARAAGKKKRK